FVREYLASSDEGGRSKNLDELQELPFPEEPGPQAATGRLDVLTRVALRMPPPLAADAPPGAGPKIHRVPDDGNEVPTEYAVFLPPEYHPLRSYPAVLALHGGDGPQSAIDWWSAEAARRGYIVVAPEYRVPEQPKDYRYSTSEHAAAELALRDARRRYAIDS